MRLNPVQKTQQSTPFIDGVPPVLFQHPLDMKLLGIIEKTPGINKVWGRLVDVMRDEEEANAAGGGCFQVTPDSHPKLYAILVSASKRMGIKCIPGLYIRPEAALDANVEGSDRPMISVTRGMVRECTDVELRFVIGREIGHYLCGHARCLSLLRIMHDVCFGIDIFSIALPIMPLLLAWSRCAEVSADRAGLLACGSYADSCSVLLKLAGYPSAFGQSIDAPIKMLKAQATTHSLKHSELHLLSRLKRQCCHVFTMKRPRLVERFTALTDWRDSGALDEIVSANQAERIRLAGILEKDVQHRDLIELAITVAAESLQERFALERITLLKALRKAFLFGESLRESVAENLLMADILIKRESKTTVSYTLVLLLHQEAMTYPVRSVMPMPCDPDWDFVPLDVREHLIRANASEATIRVYQVK